MKIRVSLTILILILNITCVSAVNPSIIGEKWSRATENARWSPRYEHTALVFDNKMWVLGGTGGNDVWDSNDGLSWIKAADSAGWLPRIAHSSVVYNDKMWVLGGESQINLKNDVWYSTNGSIWVEATENANWSPRFDHASVTYNNKIWVLGGVAEAPASPFRT